MEGVVLDAARRGVEGCPGLTGTLFEDAVGDRWFFAAYIVDAEEQLTSVLSGATVGTTVAHKARGSSPLDSHVRVDGMLESDGELLIAALGGHGPSVVNPFLNDHNMVFTLGSYSGTGVALDHNTAYVHRALHATTPGEAVELVAGESHFFANEEVTVTNVQTRVLAGCPEYDIPLESVYALVTTATGQ